MQRVLNILLLALLWQPISATAAAEEEAGLKFNGLTVDFALWAPESPEFTYDELALPAERRRHFEELETDRIYGLYRISVHLRADGDVEEDRVVIRHLLSPAAINRHGNAGTWVDAFSEVARITQAYALLPDGRRISAEAETVQLSADDQDDIFTDTFEIIVPFAGLEPGAMTVLEVRSRHKGEAYALPWSQIYYPQDFSHTEAFDFRLTWDEAVAAPLWRTDFEQLDCREEGPREVRCRAREIVPFPDDPDVSYYDALPSLVVAERSGWDDLARRVGSFMDSAYEVETGLQEHLDRLIEGADGDQERLARIHRFVSREIRYLGLEQGFGGVIPRPTHLTLARRFGDCKDKVALFIDLARRVGFTAYPVLTSTYRSDPAKMLVPAASYFNHMLACVRLPGGETCLDLTDAYSPYDALSRGAQGAIRLDAGEAAGPPGRLPAEEFTWVLDFQAENRVMADGSVEESQTRRYGGANTAWLRAKLEDGSRQERRDWLRQDYQETHSAEADPEVRVEGIDETASEVEVRTTARFDGWFEPGDFLDYREWESWLNYEAGSFTSANAVHDYVFEGLRYRGESLYRLPATYRLVHPGAEVAFESEFGSFRRRYETTEEGLVIVSELEMPRATIPAHRIPEFNRFIDHVRWNSRITFGAEAVATN